MLLAFKNIPQRLGREIVLITKLKQSNTLTLIKMENQINNGAIYPTKDSIKDKYGTSEESMNYNVDPSTGDIEAHNDFFDIKSTKTVDLSGGIEFNHQIANNIVFWYQSSDFRN